MEKISISNNSDELLIGQNHQFQTINFCDISDIVYDAPYSVVYTAKKHHLLFSSLSKLTQHLPEYFVQCNRSVVINSKQVKSFDKKTGIVLLKSNRSYFVSIRRRNTLEAVLSEILRSTHQ
ncbi:MAG: LytTR family transcriptional regulator [Dysgonamonadaceae bacterium]|jgi:DNA-binding LytR/AlgR family response regulator|nr:LytTR family transcriptional regulator [Dysgonamonadaceae bacterium]